jgi:hypothetical protein
MHDKERQIKDLRTIEAMQKNLLGPAGKFGVIVKHLGTKIFGHGGSYFGETRMDDPWDLGNDGPYEYDSTKMHEADEYGEPTFYGWHYDGLSNGVHLEIRYIEYEKELTVFWKGYVVFREINGDLDAYVPKGDWEAVVEKLFEVAFRRKMVKEKDRFEDQKVEAKGKALRFLDKMRLKWGL